MKKFGSLALGGAEKMKSNTTKTHKPTTMENLEGKFESN
jgi:hypothetical protein